MDVEIKLCSVDNGDNEKVLVIKSHWNYDEFAVLELGNKTITINAKKLAEAARRVSNWKWL